MKLALVTLVAISSSRPQALFAQHAAAAAEWAAFAKSFDADAVRDSIVGGSVILLRDGEVVARHVYGFADRAERRMVDPNTIFHYGSITKTLTAIAIMQLRDRGRLALDDRVTSYIPELRMVHDPYGSMDSVTIRMLLSHSAGFQNPTWPYTQGKSWQPFEPTTWNQLVAMMPYQELLFKPGTRFSYSNPGFIYLARIIEQLSGDPWENYVQKNILSPLGLSRSYFGTTPYYLAHDRSHNYTLQVDSSGRESVRDNGSDFDPGITIPNGGWNAPLGDLAIYLAYLTDASRGDTTKQRIYATVLRRSSLEEMWRPVHQTGPSIRGDSESMALSFFVVRGGGATIVGHTGEQAGFVSFMYLNPSTGLAVVGVLNTISDLPDGKLPAGTGPSAFNLIRERALKLIE
ncbi:MAG: beta-lactamase family protein [Gemmatimonadota bacterium]|nr:beta-lactamase family protein [Gemmatimonadota bacterium]